MTAQATERLTYKYRTLDMTTLPLDHYLQLPGKNIEFAAECTALWRGYIGSWKIEASRLYLTSLEGNLVSDYVLEDGEYVHRQRQDPLKHIFPGHVGRVFAYWYSGTLYCPLGKMTENVHAGFASQYQGELQIHVEKGVVVGEELVRHARKSHNDN